MANIMFQRHECRTTYCDVTILREVIKTLFLSLVTVPTCTSNMTSEPSDASSRVLVAPPSHIPCPLSSPFAYLKYSKVSSDPDRVPENAWATKARRD